MGRIITILTYIYINLKIQILESQAKMAEWSKAPDSSSGIARFAGSNPALGNIIFALVPNLSACTSFLLR